MEYNQTKPKWHTLLKSKLLGLSLRRDDGFIRNIIVVMGTVLVRAGMRWLLEKYLFDDSSGAYIISIIIGVLLLFLLDGSLEKLWGYKKVLDTTKKELTRDIHHQGASNTQDHKSNKK